MTVKESLVTSLSQFKRKSVVESTSEDDGEEWEEGWGGEMELVPQHSSSQSKSEMWKDEKQSKSVRDIQAVRSRQQQQQQSQEQSQFQSMARGSRGMFISSNTESELVALERSIVGLEEDSKVKRGKDQSWEKLLGCQVRGTWRAEEASEAAPEIARAISLISAPLERVLKFSPYFAEVVDFFATMIVIVFLSKVPSSRLVQAAISLAMDSLSSRVDDLRAELEKLPQPFKSIFEKHNAFSGSKLTFGFVSAVANVFS